MGPEINIDSIRVVEERIAQEWTLYGGHVIQLKRTRNSLLNISTRVPPEILGYIFCWRVIPDLGHDNICPRGIREGSYKFLLVCHYWFEVASRTPELWSFWGTTMDRWWSRYGRSKITTPLDLVLCDYITRYIPFDGPLRDAFRARIALGSIRTISLQGNRLDVQTSILSLLRPDGEDIRCSNIESVVFDNIELDVSKFFACHRLPKLRHLYLFATTNISTWDDIKTNITTLTTLTLSVTEASSTPTTSQLLSILASNPRLQTLHLSPLALPCDNGDGSTFRVPLRHLGKLDLDGDFHRVFRLLRRLDHPESMIRTQLFLYRCMVEDILGTLGPYLRDYVRRDGRFQNGLGIFVKSDRNVIQVDLSIAGGANGPGLSPPDRAPLASVEVSPRKSLPPEMLDGLTVDLLTHIPKESVVCLGTSLGQDAVKGIVAAMPNIQELRLVCPKLTERFLQPNPDGPLANTKLLPSLRYLHLEYTDVCDGWYLLLPYLAHQTSGGQVVSLRICGGNDHICSFVVENIESLVEEFILNMTLEQGCPLGIARRVRIKRIIMRSGDRYTCEGSLFAFTRVYGTYRECLVFGVPKGGPAKTRGNEARPSTL